jgi:hypothetical protein
MNLKLFILIFGGLTLGSFTKGCGKLNKAEKQATEQKEIKK